MNECSPATVWERHSDKVELFIRSKVNHDDVYQDILHDVFLKIKEKEERIKWLEQPASYIIKMAQNAVIDYYRKQKQLASLTNHQNCSR